MSLIIIPWSFIASRSGCHPVSPLWLGHTAALHQKSPTRTVFHWSPRGTCKHLSARVHPLLCMTFPTPGLETCRLPATPPKPDSPSVPDCTSLLGLSSPALLSTRRLRPPVDPPLVHNHVYVADPGTRTLACHNLLNSGCVTCSHLGPTVDPCLAPVLDQQDRL